MGKSNNSKECVTVDEALAELRAANKRTQVINEELDRDIETIREERKVIQEERKIIQEETKVKEQNLKELCIQLGLPY